MPKSYHQETNNTKKKKTVPCEKKNKATINGRAYYTKCSKTRKHRGGKLLPKIIKKARMGLKYCIQIKNKIKHNITAFINESDPNSCATLVFTVLISLCVTFFTAILEYAEPTTKDTFVEHNFPDLLDIKGDVSEWEKNHSQLYRFFCAGLSSVKAGMLPVLIFTLIYIVKHILLGGSVNVLSNIYNYFLKSKSTKKHKKFAFKQRRGLIFKAQITAMLIFTIVIVLIRNGVLTRTHISYDFSDLYGQNPIEIYKLHNIEYCVQGILGILIILIS